MLHFIMLLCYFYRYIGYAERKTDLTPMENQENNSVQVTSNSLASTVLCTDCHW